MTRLEGTMSHLGRGGWVGVGLLSLRSEDSTQG
jgi:hypothetical protein